ncbi:glycosyltransferase [Mycobacterium sp. ENV421]|uniref:glycosyltransferase n=1 Tax=Mycobacterium sp. ENV421 TaxID=1213407 RepID=UPI001E58ACB4|nr:glycosyltransferase [Mycobacterium sp. ENV421]
MRVLLVIHSLSEPGGAEFVAYQWARYLVASGDQVTVYATHPHTEETIPDGVSLVRARQCNVIAQTRDLARYLKSQPVDVVLSLMPYCNLVSVAAVRSLGNSRPKVVISGRTLERRTVVGRSQPRQQWLARRLFRYTDLFIAISHPVAAEAIALYRLPWDRVTVVPNPAIAKLEDRPAREDDSGGDPRRLDIAVPARLAPEKRPLIAVEVAAMLTQAYEYGVTVHYFGVGPLEGAIVDRARQVGVDVVMHGWVDKWFDRCPPGSVVLLTSTAEGFGNVLVEAAATGFRSVVSSHCMGSADAVVPGLTGELIAGDSAADYAAAVFATRREMVGPVAPWLRRFTFEGSGGILREALCRVTNSAGGPTRD